MRAWFLFIAAVLLSLGAMWQFAIATMRVQILGVYGMWTEAAVSSCGAMVVRVLGRSPSRLAANGPAEEPIHATRRRHQRVALLPGHSMEFAERSTDPESAETIDLMR